VQINQAVIPFSFNQINSYNNTTIYHIYRATFPLTALTGTFSLTPGNYNATNFITEWKSKLSASVAALTSYTPTFTTAFNSFDNTYSITLDDDGTYTTLVFDNNAGYTQVNLSLGFSASWSVDSGLTTSSTQCINVSPSRALYIQSDSLVTTRTYEALTSTVNTSNILEEIIINTTPGNYILFQPPNPTVSVLRNQVIDTIQLSLQDESLSQLLADMKLNWSCHIVINEWVPPESYHPTVISEQRRGNTLTQTAATPEDLLNEARRNQLLKEREIATSKLEKYKNKLLLSLPTLKNYVENKGQSAQPTTTVYDTTDKSSNPETTKFVP